MKQGTNPGVVKRLCICCNIPCFYVKGLFKQVNKVTYISFTVHLPKFNTCTMNNNVQRLGLGVADLGKRDDEQNEVNFCKHVTKLNADLIIKKDVGLFYSKTVP